MNQVTSAKFADNMKRDGDDLSFDVVSSRHPERPPKSWKVHVDESTVVGEGESYTAHIKSTWYEDGVQQRGMDMPMGFTRLGVGPTCSARWSAERKEWAW